MARLDRRPHPPGHGPARRVNRITTQDLLAGAQRWGFALADITGPALVAPGAADRMVPAAHGQLLTAHCPGALLRLIAGAGYSTVLDSAPAALDWARARVA
ncbi:MAG TPA: hypothetical protein VHV09_14180 [Trebonia sp.]|nr:hypothetical protein [Trebonia sp.]